MKSAAQLGFLFLMSTVLITLGAGLRFGFVSAILTLGWLLLGHFLLQLWITRPRVTRDG